ncbi:MAG: VOC family protein [Chloroflexota bacterium]
MRGVPDRSRNALALGHPGRRARGTRCSEIGHNRSIMLEFRVSDVDQQYARLQRKDIAWVKPPSTQEWGNRSIYFRDPDGNLINFYSQVPGAADDNTVRSL